MTYKETNYYYKKYSSMLLFRGGGGGEGTPSYSPGTYRWTGYGFCTFLS